MPKKLNALSPKEQRRLFEEEVRKRKEAGDFDEGAAQKAIDALVKIRTKSQH